MHLQPWNVSHFVKVTATPFFFHPANVPKSPTNCCCKHFTGRTKKQDPIAPVIGSPFWLNSSFKINSDFLLATFQVLLDLAQSLFTDLCWTSHEPSVTEEALVHQPMLRIKPAVLSLQGWHTLKCVISPIHLLYCRWLLTLPCCCADCSLVLTIAVPDWLQWSHNVAAMQQDTS